MGGFNLALDLRKVTKKGEDKPKDNLNIQDFQKIDEFEKPMRSSAGNNSEQAHVMQDSFRQKENKVGFDDSSSSSSGYGFVPPPELNPNLVIPKKQESSKPAFGFGSSLGFKLNLNNVPEANQITKEDRSRIQELERKTPETFNKTVNLKLEDSESKSIHKFDQGIANNTTKAAKPMPKIPGFGGGFKLDLTKVPEANVITEEDKAKVKSKELPTISKNNFTEIKKEFRGEKPKRLNLKTKDSSTKIPNESSMISMKGKKLINLKNIEGTRNTDFKFAKFDKSNSK